MSEVCSDCGAPFASAAELATHMNEAHAGGNPTQSMETNPASTHPGFKCGLCGHVFDTPSELAAHNLEPHPDGRLAAPSST